MSTQFKVEDISRNPRQRAASAHVKISSELDNLIRRFQPHARGRVRRLALSSPRLADFAFVFPAAIYALATRQCSATDRRAAQGLTLAAFSIMHLDICELARRGGVSSWSFT